MSLLLDPARLDERRTAATGPLAPLLGSLRSEFARLHASPPVMPRDKARLTRAGGICPADGARLAFDPWSPHAHRCPRCGGIERGEAHYDAWLMWHQLWLAERAVHGALLHLLEGQPADRALATGLLEQYAESYLDFPNRDNALGPSRVFFSTYLVSIWLLQVCLAVDFLEEREASGSLGDRVRDRVIEPAVRMIAEFDEGASNRQVWNVVALLAAGQLLGDGAIVREAVGGRAGLMSHLAQGLLEDGSWYEGENYHMFAHRGLWYGVTMASRAGIELPPELVRRFDEGFVTPWITALPDLTMPSRRDSPHAVSMRQWRFAEMAELGVARTGDDRLRGALARLYGDDVPRRDTGRSRSAADVERNEAPSALSRADLGWRALLHALPSLGELHAMAPASAVLEGQGIGVLRRDEGRIYVALDYGHSGGGHGHPDRLGIILCDAHTRWLDDPGTGSYVDRTLHWYRSTLAHNAPLVDGRSQLRTEGWLLAFDEMTEAGWIDAAADEIAPGVSARRSVTAMPDYIVDSFEWTSVRPVRVELPMHADGASADVQWQAAPLDGGSGLEDGFEFVGDSERAVRVEQGSSTSEETRAQHGALRLHPTDGATVATAHVFADPPVEWMRARAPGPPGSGARRFHIARWAGTAGRLTTVWDLRGRLETCEAANGRIVVRRRDGSLDEHERTPGGWRVTISERDHREAIAAVDRLIAGSAGFRVIELRNRPAGERRVGSRAMPAAASLARREPHLIRATPLIFELGEAHYRRSEQSWAEAGQPRAVVAIEREGGHLGVGVRVFTAEPTFAPADAVNDMDNEHPDVNGHGVQLHIRTPGFTAAWMAVPEPADRIRLREIAGSEAGWLPDGGWQRMDDGYRLKLLLPLHALGDGPSRPISLDVLVNETTPARERRRGQLVLSGARGEWVYLRGDRQSPDRFIPFIIDDA